MSRAARSTGYVPAAQRVEEQLDFKAPDYVPIFRERVERLTRLRAKPGLLDTLKVHYKANPADFINDWGVTFEPRNVERDLPAVVPFILFNRQREYVRWVMERWRARENGACEKSRDMGMSWLNVSLSCTLCLFYPGMSIGFGSRKEEYVDKLDSPKSLFWKARAFMAHLPVEFRGGWDPAKHGPHMRLTFPQTGSYMGGEAGDNIGRGDRTGLYFVDEAAHLEHPETVDAALSQTTNCAIYGSSANGTANPFYEKRKKWANTPRLFTFHWRDDPRKDNAWYEGEKEEINNPVIVAQELDIDYSASVEGVLIPSAWVQAAVDAHLKIGFPASGAKRAALDVADGGADLNAFVGGHGVVIQHVEDWSGKGDDIFESVERTFRLCDELGFEGFTYDADGLGAGVRGDSRIINDRRRREKMKEIKVEQFRGSGAILEPEREDIKGRKNKDMFVNAKAQQYWRLRVRFQKTFRYVTAGVQCPHNELISISSEIPARARERLIAELSQPQYVFRTGDGKMLVDKVPEGAASPNLADGVMMWSKGRSSSLVITAALLAKTAGGAQRMMAGAR